MGQTVQEGPIKGLSQSQSIGECPLTRNASKINSGNPFIAKCLMGELTCTLQWGSKTQTSFCPCHTLYLLGDYPGNKKASLSGDFKGGQSFKFLFSDFEHCSVMIALSQA